MRPLPVGRKPKFDKVVTANSENVVAAECPEPAELPPELAELVNAWRSLSEATRTTILMLLRADSSGAKK